MTVIQRSQGATALVGLSELVVGAQVFVDGEWWLNVETPLDVVACETCGTRAVGHGRTRTEVRDLPVAGVPSVLVFAVDDDTDNNRPVESNSYTLPSPVTSCNDPELMRVMRSEPPRGGL